MSDDQDGCEWVSFLLVPAHPGCPGQKPLNGCVCVCVCSGTQFHLRHKVILEH